MKIYHQRGWPGATLLALVYATMLLPAGSMAQAYQDHASIHRAAKDFMQAHVRQNYSQPAQIRSGKLDQRLRLQQCDQPLQAFLPKGSRAIGKTTVGVKCTGSKAWSLHVPVTVSMVKPIAVATRLLPRGSIISRDDIRMKALDLSALPQGYIDNSDSLVGKKLKRRLSPGVAFTPAIIEKPQRIKRGQRVTILARYGAMEVRMTGKALANGAVGDRIRVVNLASKKKREGVVTTNGEVKVDL